MRVEDNKKVETINPHQPHFVSTRDFVVPPLGNHKTVTIIILQLFRIISAMA